MDPKEIWQTALGELEVTLSKANFTTWFKDTFLLSISDQEATVGVPNGFAKEWLENKFHPEILKALQKINPKILKITYKISTQVAPPRAPKLVKTDMADISPVEHPHLNGKYQFDNFVIGNSNRLAAATAQAVSTKPGLVYNPLFLYGGVGLGKTHLVQAIGNEILKKSPKKKIVYVSCERFTNDYVQSISHNKTDEFKKKYRGVDVFLVDDIQFLSGKEGTQEEFFHTFNTLHQSNRQIVITSDRVPKAIPQMQDRLSSRFGAGMVADIQPPNLEMREAILRSKSLEKEFPMDDNVLNFIATNIESNIRELEGAINRIMAYCQLNRITPSLDTVTKVLEDIVASKGKNLSVEKIISTVGGYFKIESAQLLSPKRDRILVGPRQIVMYLLRHEMNLSFPKIGHELNKKDHTTIMHGVSKIEREIASNENLKKELTMIKEQLYSA
ncbi:MAG: chromosomal replication initiator protein DnaA [Candidatus Berkelbacteria bacterium]|nr:chromosomal replication initiator protein DnaA [Candidatus Berkelbacteria bacterium]